MLFKDAIILTEWILKYSPPYKFFEKNFLNQILINKRDLTNFESKTLREIYDRTNGWRLHEAPEKFCINSDSKILDYNKNKRFVINKDSTLKVSCK